ncbi:hypothetical protein Glove_299g3 [Diversispora epigaea]|uniref:Uncharacterized protein n=1 Tax=Diversispora epigaea TaxID=1348612 RepID=A0A397HX24_9GLOM|nr:hypothetical protein Glove_299g3 [Diversispora epigaea]
MASDSKCNSDQENIANKLCIKEELTYPLNNKILYKECVNNITKRSFNYVIVKKDVYLDDFKFSIRCEINYDNNIHIFQFQIKYGPDFQQVVSSNISPSTVASIYEKTLNPNTKTTISGPLLFGLQLNAKRRGHLIKPALNCVLSTLEKRAKKIGTIIQSNFKNDINKIYHPSNKVTLKTVEFSVNQMEYQVNFECKNQLDENYIQSIVKAIDHGQISRDSY